MFAVTERIRVLTDMRNQALADARKIVDDAEAENRLVLSAEEDERYNRFIGDWDKYNAALEREVEAENRASASADQREQFVAPPQADAPKGPTLEEWMLRAVKGQGEHRAEVELVPDQYNALKPEVRSFIGQREFRTDYPLTSGDAATTYSSYVVPTIVAPYIEELKFAYSAILQAGVNPVTTEGINTMYIPKVSTAPTINMAGAATSFENTAPTDSSYPVLGRTQLDGYRCDAFVVITEEDIASASVDMMAFLNRTLSGALAAKIAYYLAVGSGSNAPKGIFIAATTGKTAASDTTFTGDEVIDTYQSISAQYRPGLRCAISQSAESKLSKLKNGQGDYIWRSGMIAGNPDSIQGVPCFVDPQGPALTTGLKPIVFYNPTNFHVRWCMGGRVMYDVSTEAQFTKFNRVIRIAQWMDCDAGDAGGCKSLTLA